MATAAERITADEFLARVGEESHIQLIRGQVVVEVPGWAHQGFEGEIFGHLWTWTRAAPGRGAARTEVHGRISEHDVFVPDVLWIAEERVPARDAGHLTSPPDLAVEVRSPSTWRYDIGAKKEGYERAGLRELWLVNPPARTVTVFRRSSAAEPRFDVAVEVAPPEPLTSPMLPGFSLDLAALFA